jgi:transcriptional regulator with XRE-family HTH domain
MSNGIPAPGASNRSRFLADGKKFQRLFALLGLNVTALANQSGISRRRLTDWLSGDDFRSNGDKFVTVIRTLGFDPSEFDQTLPDRTSVEELVDAHYLSAAGRNDPDTLMKEVRHFSELIFDSWYKDNGVSTEIADHLDKMTGLFRAMGHHRDYLLPKELLAFGRFCAALLECHWIYRRCRGNDRTTMESLYETGSNIARRLILAGYDTGFDLLGLLSHNGPFKGMERWSHIDGDLTDVQTRNLLWLFGESGHHYQRYFGFPEFYVHVQDGAILRTIAMSAESYWPRLNGGRDRLVDDAIERARHAIDARHPDWRVRAGFMAVLSHVQHRTAIRIVREKSLELTMEVIDIYRSMLGDNHHLTASNKLALLKLGYDGRGSREMLSQAVEFLSHWRGVGTDNVDLSVARRLFDSEFQKHLNHRRRSG